MCMDGHQDNSREERDGKEKGAGVLEEDEVQSSLEPGCGEHSLALHTKRVCDPAKEPAVVRCVLVVGFSCNNANKKKKKKKKKSST